MGYLLKVLQPLLGKMSKEALSSLATRLSMIGGRTIPNSVSGIMKYLGQLAKDHPIKAAIAMNVLIEFFPDLDLSALYSDMGDSQQASELIAKIEKSRKEARENALGDGNPGTAMGLPTENVMEAAIGIEHALTIYNAGVIGAGGRNALESIRKAIMLEDTVYNACKRLSNQY